MTIKIGDTVRAWGRPRPDMIVEEIAASKVTCAWFNKSDGLERHVFNADVLAVIPQKSHKVTTITAEPELDTSGV